MISDYRLWIHLRACYEDRYRRSRVNSISNLDSAFQLALLFTLHIGTQNQNNEATIWLIKSGRLEKDMNNEIEKIRQIKAVQFSDKEVEIDRIDLVDQLGKLGLLETARKEYKNTADRLELIFGTSHILVLLLRLTISNVYRAQGKLRRAEEILLAIAATSESDLGLEHKLTLAINQQLILVYMDRCSWPKAKLLQTSVLEKFRRVLGEHSEQTQLSLGNLAVIYWNVRQFDKAEKIQTEQLDLLQQTRGQRHKKTLTTMINLSSTYEYQGRLDEALKL